MKLNKTKINTFCFTKKFIKKINKNTISLQIHWGIKKIENKYLKQFITVFFLLLSPLKK